MQQPSKLADIAITIKTIRNDDGTNCYLASAAETATDYGAHLGNASARSIRAALNDLAKQLNASEYTRHSNDEAVQITYFGAGGQMSQCSTSLIDWSFDRATRVANKLIGD